MLTLLDPMTTPSGGYKYFIEATQTWLSANTLLDLARAMVTHHNSNQLPSISETEAEKLIEDQLCKNLPPGHCRDVEGNVRVAGTSITLDVARQGLATLAHFLLDGRNRVDATLANERAKTCSRCYANIEATGANCTTCAKAAFQAVSTAVVGGDKTDYDAYLNFCSVCACPLKAKVWVTLPIIKAHMPPQQLSELPPHCWILKEAA